MTTTIEPARGQQRRAHAAGTPRGSKHGRTATGAHKPLPYSVARSAASALRRAIEGGTVEESLLDLAWLGLETPRPDGLGYGERVTVWLSKEEAAKMRGFIDGDRVDVEVLSSIRARLKQALEA